MPSADEEHPPTKRPPHQAVSYKSTGTQTASSGPPPHAHASQASQNSPERKSSAIAKPHVLHAVPPGDSQEHLWNKQDASETDTLEELATHKHSMSSVSSDYSSLFLQRYSKTERLVEWLYRSHALPVSVYLPLSDHLSQAGKEKNRVRITRDFCFDFDTIVRQSNQLEIRNPVRGLIDTGSDFNMVSLAWVEQVGIPFKRIKPYKIGKSFLGPLSAIGTIKIEYMLARGTPESRKRLISNKHGFVDKMYEGPFYVCDFSFEQESDNRTDVVVKDFQLLIGRKLIHKALKNLGRCYATVGYRREPPPADKTLAEAKQRQKEEQARMIELRKADAERKKVASERN